MSTTVSTIGKVATFLRGLNVMMPFQLCVVGSSFAMKRFGYKEEAVSIFVAFCSNAMELFYLFATLSTLAVVTILKASTPKMFTYISSGISKMSVCFTVVLNVLLLRLYAMDDSVDNVTRYYWLLLLANVAAGVDDTCIYAIALDCMSQYDLGFSTTGIVVAGFHMVTIKILECIGANVDYWLIVSQLLFIVVISTIAAILWLWFLLQEKIMHASGVSSSGGAGEGNIRNGVSPSGFAKGLAQSTPMIVVSAVSVSSMWAIYPYISPYQVTPFEYHYPIQRLCLIFHALSGFTTWLVDNIGDYVRHDWYKYPHAWLHMMWLLLVPYLGIGILFLRCMHYPESGLPQAVLRNPFVVGCLTVVYFTISRFFFGITCVVIDANAMGHGEVISPFNLACSVTATNVLKYMSEAYVQQFKLAKEGVKAGKAWPTDGMSEHSALRYWIRNAATLGYSNFKDLATADVKQRLGSVPRHIASYRGANP